MRRMEALEPRWLLSGWQELPVDALPLAGAGASNTAAYELLGAPQERTTYGYTGAGLSVAILDTGLDYLNPAFAGRYLGGWDFVNHDADPRDDNGHGTHVAGIIGSGDATYPGVTPGVGLVALKVLDASGQGSFGDVEQALAWVIAHRQQYGIAAVNMSLGSGDYQTNPFTFLDSDLQQLREAGVSVFAAAGNDYALDHSQPGLAFPAIDPLVISVGAVWAADYGAASWTNGAQDYATAADQLASFSQRGPQLDLLAPGAYVTSTYLDNSFASLAGTSAATPMAVGAALVVRQALDAAGQPDDPAAVLRVLQQTGVTITDADAGRDNVQHTGLSFPRVDVLAAVAAVAPAETPDERYVRGLYESILRREPDAGGLTYWSGLLAQGAARSSLIDAIWQSPEHLGLEVQADYLAILGRDVDPDGLTYWVRQRQAGLSDSALQQLLYASDEFYRRLAG